VAENLDVVPVVEGAGCFADEVVEEGEEGVDVWDAVAQEEAVAPEYIAGVDCP
jgi:hypothetical protein